MEYRPIAQREVARPRHRGRWVLLGFVVAVIVALGALIAMVTAGSGVTLASDATALARVNTQPFAGTLVRADAFGVDGRSIPLAVAGGRLTPLAQLTPGEVVSVEVVIRRPGWLSWALGSLRQERLTLRAPVARVTQQWVTVAPGSPVPITFDQPVSAVAYASGGRPGTRQSLSGAQRTVAFAAQAPAGTIEVAAAVRSWEKLSAPAAVTWFPQSPSPVLIASPAPGSQLSPADPIRLTFSDSVATLFGSSLPQLSPATPGAWRRTDSHTLLFTPSGAGAPLGSDLSVVLPRAMAVTGAAALAPASAQIAYSVPPGSTLRLQQLLAQQGYLPVTWTPAGAPVARTGRAQAAAAITPPTGAFSWRYPNTPAELQALWAPGHAGPMTRGAVMVFEHAHGLDVDGVAGPMVWHALLTDAIAASHPHAGYSYVYVHRKVPQLLTLWSSGHTVLTSPGNTGVPAAPTLLGTFPVFEHIPVGTMSGTNPDGSHYHDPGIRYISYFNGGDAIHAFNRGSFGTPQSLGCVELPLTAAAEVWPYTPLGTLVTVEN